MTDCDAHLAAPVLPPIVADPPSGPGALAAPALPPLIGSPPVDPARMEPPVLPALGSSVGGPRGYPGPAGASDQVLASGIADGILSGHRVVVIDDGTIRYADPTDNSDAFRPMHLTLGAIDDAAAAEVLALGTTTEGSWTWTPGVRLFVGAGGTLTETIPTGVAFVRVVAFTRDATSIYFDPQVPIHLEA